MEETELKVIGGLYEARARLFIATQREGVTECFSAALRQKRNVALVSARRSFGEHYLPPEGEWALDVSELDRNAELLERESDGSVWVRAGGGVRFSDLFRKFERHRAYCPPTTDTISLAGALAVCSHNSRGYFADSVRAFSLTCPDGRVYRCRRGVAGLEGELFEAAVGALGALGVISDIELKLSPIAPDQKVIVHALYAGRSDSGAYLNYLERAFEDPRFGEGAAAAVYGNRGHAIVFGDELLPPGSKPVGRRALLTDDNIGQQAFTQALVNRSPRLAEWLVARTYRQGAALWAPWYGFQFFQRGYDEAHRVMAAGGPRARLLQVLGVPRRLPLAHSSWFFPRAELRNFMEGYFEIQDRYPGIEGAVEQQDLVLLGPCAWPCHSMGRTEHDLGIFTASFSVRRGEASETRAREFLQAVTRECPSFASGARVSLAKQVHATPEVLAEHHRTFVERVRGLKAKVDPQRILRSRLLDALGI